MINMYQDFFTLINVKHNNIILYSLVIKHYVLQFWTKYSNLYYLYEWRIIIIIFSVYDCRMVCFVSISVPRHWHCYHIHLREESKSRRGADKCTSMRVFNNTVRFDLRHWNLRSGQNNVTVSYQTIRPREHYALLLRIIEVKTV